MGTKTGIRPIFTFDLGFYRVYGEYGIGSGWLPGGGKRNGVRNLIWDLPHSADCAVLIAVFCWKHRPPVVRFAVAMGNFGEELRRERLARGVALEEITAVTKISQRHLVALEEERFRLLPGGILSKGIVRGYAGALGLDQQDWTDRFLRAYQDSGESVDPNPDWTAFASNVGRARILRHDEAELRLRWLGAVLLAIVVAILGLLTVRFIGLRAGWWSSLLPFHTAGKAHAFLLRVISMRRPF